ncbi:BTAD domain-containing putative transcriptional regulator [Streptomyces sp. TG1A-8]|uniref:BTAD domain-containing putative transcriptional regulator n=1 Tax=Streptomyces sp. TG1A-8 TaxID=3051385 RepID=UPI00265B9C4E|nr:BTAD domain-containing putative transcriptional regulator [Streptomyces sp. TG1A-8]MDO0924957.1 BTAD domain-containing putative transcriptional regulator [Streptomyces sp. TG1A-8]
MQFFLLGPLEATSNGRQLPLGGTKQRLALALLLLRHNSLVPVGQLTDALWPGDVPVSARKMLHNAVSGLRKSLSGDADEDPPLLLTRSPGYLLRVAPGAIDLVRFQDLAAQGQAALAAGRWDQAARSLRGALDIWRGPLLSDLAEQTADWPEVSAARSAWLTALEGRLEADIHLGRQGEVLSELEVLVEQEPLRERLCGQLMRVLYQRGRQADALGVYSRTRNALVEQLGLDPSPELQELERAILNHDVSLAGAPPLAAHTRGTPAGPPAVAGRRTGRGGTGPGSGEGGVLEELRQVSTVLVAAGPAPYLTAGPEDLHAVRDHVGGIVREEAQFHQARVAEAEGAADEAVGALLARARESWRNTTGCAGSPVWMAAADPAAGESGPWRALRLAHAISGRLTAEPGCRAADGRWLPFEVRVVVVTGAAITRQGDAASSWARPSEDLVRLCLRLLEDRGAGPLRVCPTTAEAVRLLDRPDHLPFVGRDHELCALDFALESTLVHRQPHLLTVFGDAGTGRTRLLDEWMRRCRESRTAGPPVTFLVGRTSSAIGGGRSAALAELVRAAADIDVTDPPPLATARLAGMVDGVVDERRAPWMLAHLSALLDTDTADASVPADAFDAWAQFFESLAAQDPLVLVLENLQWSDDTVLDFLNHLLERSSGVPLLVVASARPDLLDRRAAWGGGKLRSTSLCLRPLEDADAARVMWDAYRSARVSDGRFLPEHCPDALVPVAGALGGNPLFAIEYGRLLSESGWPESGLLPDAMPYSMRSRLETMLDLLPPQARAVLYDAALCGEWITESRLAVLAGGDRHRAVGRWLRLLVQRGIMCSSRHPGEGQDAPYAFAHHRLREVALSRVPEAVRKRKAELIRATCAPRPRSGVEPGGRVRDTPPPHGLPAAGFPPAPPAECGRGPRLTVVPAGAARLTARPAAASPGGSGSTSAHAGPEDGRGPGTAGPAGPPGAPAAPRSPAAVRPLPAGRTERAWMEKCTPASLPGNRPAPTSGNGPGNGARTAEITVPGVAHNYPLRTRVTRQLQPEYFCLLFPAAANR